jgi:hypothetical protein
MSYLPEGRVDYAQLRSEHLLVVQVAYQLQGSFPRIGQHLG